MFCILVYRFLTRPFTSSTKFLLCVCRIELMLQNGPGCISYTYIFLHHFAVGPDLNSKHCALPALHTQWKKFHIAIWYLDIRYKEASVRVIPNDDRTIICTFQSNGLTVAGIYKVCIDVIVSYGIIIRIWRLKWLDLSKRAPISWITKTKTTSHKTRKKSSDSGNGGEEKIQILKIESATVEQLVIKVNRPLTKSSTKVLFWSKQHVSTKVDS